MSPTGIAVRGSCAREVNDVLLQTPPSNWCPGRRMGLMPNSELCVQPRPPSSNRVLKPALLAVPPGLAAVNVKLHRVGWGATINHGAQRRIREDMKETGVEPKPVFITASSTRGKAFNYRAAEGVELAEVDPEPLGQNMGEDDAGERGRLVEGNGGRVRGVGRGQQRAGFSPVSDTCPNWLSPMMVRNPPGHSRACPVSTLRRYSACPA